MPSFTLAPADTGSWNGYQTLVGAATAWQAVDDSPHDGDFSYFRLPALAALPSHAGRVSTRIVQMGLARVLPLSVVVSVTARVNIAGGTDAELVAGFSNAHQVVAVGAPFELTAAYVQYDTAFAVNPFTGAAWRVGDLKALELYVATSSFPVPTQQVRVTAMQIAVTHDDRTYWST